MNILVCGSRSYPALRLVEWYIRDLPAGVVVLSGGARGVDQTAAAAATARGLKVVEHLPDLTGCMERHQFTKAYYARNELLVKDAHLVIAFTERDSGGGTWHVIKTAVAAGKPVKVIRPPAYYPGAADAPEESAASEEEPTPAEAAREARKGQGPFQIRRVSLGSYALRRKSYIPSEEYAQFISDKDAAPEKLAEKMLPAFLRFFETHRKFGVLHAITVPPRSKRHLDRPHVMDILTERLAKDLGVPRVVLFQPWEKSTRGRFAVHGEIAVAPGVEKFIGKVIWCCDDVTCTNRTLSAAVQSLMALEIHAHGLAYIVMA